MIALYTVVLPIVVTVTAVVQLMDDPAIGKVIGGVVTSVITVGAHLASGPRARSRCWSGSA